MRLLIFGILVPYAVMGCQSVKFVNLNKASSDFTIEETKPIPAISWELMRIDF